jgi:uncharacterized membrane-anchored protein
MTAPRSLDDVLRAGIDATVLPPDARLPVHETRPWPVVLLTALGAWLAAVPLLGVVGLLLGDIISRGIGPYFVGVLVLAGAAVVLRARTVPVFVEQLATPALLVGAGALSFGLFRDLPDQLAALVLIGVAAGMAWAIARAWLRALLGASAAVLLLVLLVPSHSVYGPNAQERFWIGLHGVLVLWLLAVALQHRALGNGARARIAQALESWSGGWAVVLLVGLAWLAGFTFLMGGSVGADVGRALSPGNAFGDNARLLQSGSVLLACIAFGIAARAWRGVQQPLLAGVALVLAVLCWFLPTLGAVLVVLAVTATTHRWHLATAAGVAAAWIIGAFYYQLQWELAFKAVVLVGAGTVLGALAWLAQRQPGRTHAPAIRESLKANLAAVPARAAMWIALATVATLAVANFAIWQKENIIGKGQPVFVELAPVDPRSLMQGDYMRLNFSLPPDLEKDLDGLVTRQRPHVIARNDARGVARLLRLARPEAPLAPGEFRIELTPKNGAWILVTDAWFFREGDAAQWEKAKFGEFRILPNGAALLVGMADAQLKPIAR